MQIQSPLSPERDCGHDPSSHRPTSIAPRWYATMADKERSHEEGNEALDPELLYTKEYCIGMFIGKLQAL